MIEIKVLVTSALPYVHDMPHLGNIVGSVLPADVYHRYLKLAGHDTIYICGSDSHGTMFEITAEKLGITPEQLVFKNHELIQEIFRKFNIEFTFYGITHSEENKEITYHIFNKLDENGHLIEEEMELPYCSNCNKFLADRWIEGKCPHCEGLARGDQCDDCGELMTPQEIIKPKCVHCGKGNIEFRKTRHLFLDLPKFEPWLKEWISGKSWSPLVKNFSLGWLKEGLKPRTITRDATWGFPVPKKGYEEKVIYVWFDAPIGYIGITKEWSNKIGKPDEWKKWWLEDCKYVQFMGKDNVPFHSITFPATLKGTEGSWNLVDNLVGSAWLISKDVKFSKSRGRGLTTEDALEIRPVDYWRYVLMSLYPESDDSTFTWEEFRRRVNNELSDIIGNFVHRVLSFTKLNYGKIPGSGELKKEDREILEKLEKIHGEVTENFERARLREALKGVIHLAKESNAYFNNQEPWHLVKKDRGRAATVLNLCCNLVRSTAILLNPFLPESSGKIWKFLKDDSEMEWDSAREIKLSDHEIEKPIVLFKKVTQPELKEIKSKYSKETSEKEGPAESKETPGEPSEEDPFPNLDLRVAEIKEVKDHPNADKLYVFKIDCGEERQIVAGIKEWYNLTFVFNEPFDGLIIRVCVMSIYIFF
ncbi:MAG: methionine--tRNA ligase [archaeon]|nr:MAG: methionine--tRNA ligase [archaeon]